MDSDGNIQPDSTEDVNGFEDQARYTKRLLRNLHPDVRAVIRFALHRGNFPVEADVTDLISAANSLGELPAAETLNDKERKALRKRIWNALRRAKHSAKRYRGKFSQYRIRESEDGDEEFVEHADGDGAPDAPERAYIDEATPLAQGSRAADDRGNARKWRQEERSRAVEKVRQEHYRLGGYSANPRPDVLARDKDTLEAIGEIRWTALRQCALDAELLKEAQANTQRCKQPLADVPMGVVTERRGQPKLPGLRWDWWDWACFRNQEPRPWPGWDLFHFAPLGGTRIEVRTRVRAEILRDWCRSLIDLDGLNQKERVWFFARQAARACGYEPFPNAVDWDYTAPQPNYPRDLLRRGMDRSEILRPWHYGDGTSRAPIVEYGAAPARQTNPPWGESTVEFIQRLNCIRGDKPRKQRPFESVENEGLAQHVRTWDCQRIAAFVNSRPLWSTVYLPEFRHLLCEWDMEKKKTRYPKIVKKVAKISPTAWPIKLGRGTPTVLAHSGLAS